MEKMASSVAFRVSALAVCVFIMLAPTFFSVPSPFTGLGMIGVLLFLCSLAGDGYVVLKNKHPRLFKYSNIAFWAAVTIAGLATFAFALYALANILGMLVVILIAFAEKCLDVLHKILIIIDRLAA